MQLTYNMIAKEAWQGFCEVISKYNQGLEVGWEILGLDIGDQIEEEWVRMYGLSYDSRADVLYVHTEPMDHPIKRPQRIVLAERGAALDSISIQSIDGQIQVIQFRAPLRLEGQVVEV